MAPVHKLERLKYIFGLILKSVQTSIQGDLPASCLLFTLKDLISQVKWWSGIRTHMMPQNHGDINRKLSSARSVLL